VALRRVVLTGLVPERIPPSGHFVMLTGVVPERLPPMGRFVKSELVGCLGPTRLAPRVQVVTVLTGVVPERLPPMRRFVMLTGVVPERLPPMGRSVKSEPGEVSWTKALSSSTQPLSGGRLRPVISTM